MFIFVNDDTLIIGSSCWELAEMCCLHRFLRSGLCTGHARCSHLLLRLHWVWHHCHHRRGSQEPQHLHSIRYHCFPGHLPHCLRVCEYTCIRKSKARKQHFGICSVVFDNHVNHYAHFLPHKCIALKVVLASTLHCGAICVWSLLWLW